MHIPALLIALALATPGATPAGSEALVDPRAGGLTVAMGEWTLVPEVKAIRPGHVTFVVANRGRFTHGFRIRSAGDGGTDRFERRTEVIAPGKTARLTVELAAGAYDIECYVEDAHGDHEALGMHALLSVRARAPFVKPAPRGAANRVKIAGFAFNPTAVRVQAGTTVKWVNEDPAKHTVSARSGAFTSTKLAKGQAYSRKFATAGSFVYLCAIHPRMSGRVVVSK